MTIDATMVVTINSISFQAQESDLYCQGCYKLPEHAETYSGPEGENDDLDGGAAGGYSDLKVDCCQEAEATCDFYI